MVQEAHWSRVVENCRRKLAMKLQQYQRCNVRKEVRYALCVYRSLQNKEQPTITHIRRTRTRWADDAFLLHSVMLLKVHWYVLSVNNLGKVKITVSRAPQLQRCTENREQRSAELLLAERLTNLTYQTLLRRWGDDESILCVLLR